MRIEDYEREAILKTMAEHGNNRAHTAKALNMSIRTIRYKVKRYKEDGHFVEAEPQQRESDE